MPLLFLTYFIAVGCQETGGRSRVFACFLYLRWWSPVAGAVAGATGGAVAEAMVGLQGVRPGWC